VKKGKGIEYGRVIFKWDPIKSTCVSVTNLHPSFLWRLTPTKIEST